MCSGPACSRRALTWAYVLLAVAYASVGAVGYTLYGVHSQELLLMDMGPSGGQRVSHNTRVLLNIMLAALTMKALCAVPVELLVMADVLQRELQSIRGILPLGAAEPAAAHAALAARRRALARLLRDGAHARAHLSLASPSPEPQP